ncbi:hypothetical protein E2L08_05435 [Palleronia sediminis]|uniref:Tetratricopeptide repeat protein n=1 Tax=Palleronia sediminis TaxID=2547833 RepID=A0A4R6AES2_9RHOB|nr:hypothetical protein [Palleronia sediminis]TDL81562.1 hypothetical protein E2L08_05435 [Palleronia sediminis]
MKPVFVSRKRDGLGERLRGLVNAFAVADRFGGEVRFAWRLMGSAAQPFHAICEAEKLFSERFLERYLMSPEAADALVCCPITDIESNGFGLVEPQQGYSVFQNPLTSMLPSYFSKEDLGSVLQTAFSKIEFSSEIANIREKVSGLKLPENAVAIHLRAGDIVYGKYRFSNDFRVKVISYPIAVEIIKTSHARNEKPVLFGQDRELIRWLADEYGAISSVELFDAVERDPLHLAMSEIFLMARMNRLVSGNSGFALLASAAGAVPHENPYLSRTKEENEAAVARHMLDRDFSAPPSLLQKANACCSMMYQRRGIIAKNREQIALLRNAIAYDPDNPFYRVSLAVSMLNRGSEDRAEKIITRLLNIHNANCGEIFNADALSRPGLMELVERLRPCAGKAECPNISKFIERVDEVRA